MTDDYSKSITFVLQYSEVKKFQVLFDSVTSPVTAQRDKKF